jgi:glucose/arabinose dehydrogenase
MSRRRHLVSGFAALLLLGSCGGGGGGTPSPSPTPSPTPTPTNRAPSFTSASTVSAAENSGGTIYTATASDPDGDALTFSIAGGADAAAFRISAAGALSFAAPPDFELPADADRNNQYLVRLQVSDGRASATLDLTVTVTDAATDGFRVSRVGVGFASPLFLAPVPDGSGRVFVVERGGRVRILNPATGAIAATPFLDLSSQVRTDSERGLLGFATAPDFPTSGVVYVYLTNLDGDIELRRYRTPAGTRESVDPASADVLLVIEHSQFGNHNGGWIGFGPDNLLYVAVGDGGGSGDPLDNGQNRNSLLGKILRLDVGGDQFPADPNRDYVIPAGNPFAGGGGAPEIWALGLRNPFRASFDSGTGNLLIGDVGQGAIEEIDLMRPGDGGANFGWPLLEGTRPFRGGAGAGPTLPVAEYPHGSGSFEGRSVTGGYVYRGPVEALQGLYIFADFVTGNIWSIPVSELVVGQTVGTSRFTARRTEFTPNQGAIGNVASFGLDQARNLYIVDFDGEIFRIELR